MIAVFNRTYQRLLLLVISLGFFFGIGQKLNHFNSGPVVCPFFLLTGMPCPTCGTTRSIYWILSGDPVLAARFNPLGFVVLAAILVWVFRGESFLTHASNLVKNADVLTKPIPAKSFWILAAILILNFARFKFGFFPR